MKTQNLMLNNKSFPSVDVEGLGNYYKPSTQRFCNTFELDSLCVYQTCSSVMPSSLTKQSSAIKARWPCCSSIVRLDIHSTHSVLILSRFVIFISKIRIKYSSGKELTKRYLTFRDDCDNDNKPARKSTETRICTAQIVQHSKRNSSLIVQLSLILLKKKKFRCIHEHAFLTTHDLECENLVNSVLIIFRSITILNLVYT